MLMVFASSFGQRNRREYKDADNARTFQKGCRENGIRANFRTVRREGDEPVYSVTYH